MKPDLFKNLPPEIITEIFLRLPAVSIPISKFVCKRWLHLLEPDDFVKSHFARSAPALVVLGKNSDRLEVLELEGELDLHLHLDPLTKYGYGYGFPYRRAKIYSSVNGFLLLRKCGYDALKVRVEMLSVCNPITREVIKLDLLASDPDLPSDPELSTSELSAYGFGASKITGRYKVVCFKLECHVYTLGTGSWRRVEGNPYLEQYGPGAFVNGNLHWIATIGEDSSWISCFDLETECFSFFKALPTHPQGLPFRRGRSLSALSGCLWFCEKASEYENGGGRRELTIWIMKEYGVDESWSKEYVIPIDDSMRLVVPIKVFENGDLLMLVTVCFSGRLFYYSNKNKTMQRIDLFGADRVECGLFTPTLVSLKTLGLGVENVISF